MQTIPNAKDAEIAIVGGGLAGRLLAYRYISETRKSVCLIDPSNQREDHIFGFFDDGRDSIKLPRALASHSFSRWTINNAQIRTTHTPRAHRYRLISASDYEQHLLNHCQSSERFTLIRDRVENQVRMGDATQLRLHSGETIRVKQCFDSRANIANGDYLMQHFLGQYVRVQTPTFNPKSVELMNFSVDQSAGMHFMYLLPFSETEALVESTVYSTETHDADWYKAHIDDFLSKNYTLADYEVYKTEQGVIPLTYDKPNDSFGTAVGLRAGALRTSSGYAFSQIHDQVYRIDLGNPQKIAESHTQVERWMDDILLRVLRNYPDIAPAVFNKMAQVFDGDQFATFMLGRSPLWDKIRLILRLPKQPFLHQTLLGKRMTQ